MVKLLEFIRDFDKGYAAAGMKVVDCANDLQAIADYIRKHRAGQAPQHKDAK
jgi:hypothetical protein